MSRWRGSNSRSLGPKPSGLPAFPHLDENPTCQRYVSIFFYLVIDQKQKTLVWFYLDQGLLFIFYWINTNLLQKTCTYLVLHGLVCLADTVSLYMWLSFSLDCFYPCFLNKYALVYKSNAKVLNFFRFVKFFANFFNFFLQCRRSLSPSLC